MSSRKIKNNVGTDTDDIATVWISKESPTQPLINRQIANLNISGTAPRTVEPPRQRRTFKSPTRSNSSGPYYVVSFTESPPKDSRRAEFQHDQQNGMHRSFDRTSDASYTSSQGSSLPSSPTFSSSSPSRVDGREELDRQKSPKYSVIDDAVERQSTPSNDQNVSFRELRRTDSKNSRSSLYAQSNRMKDRCFRCKKKVYPMEKVGPLKDMIYHRACCTCFVCGIGLNINSAQLNRDDIYDLNIYCKKHQPNIELMQATIRAKNIQSALHAPKLDPVNFQIRGRNPDGSPQKIDSRTLPNKSTTNNQGRSKSMRQAARPKSMNLGASPIAHALHYNTLDSQPRNITRHRPTSWTQDRRTPASDSVPNLVRHSDPVNQYDPAALAELYRSYYNLPPADYEDN